MEIGISGGSKNTATRIENFYGLNRNRRPSAGEMEAMKNMTSREFPCAAPCGGRNEIVKTDGEILAVTAPDEAFTDSITGFTGVIGQAFYYNGVRKTTLKGYNAYSTVEIDLPEGCQWEIEKMGDMYILNGYNPTEKRSEMFYYDIDTDEFGYGGKVMPKMVIGIGEDASGVFIEALIWSAQLKDFLVNHSDGTVYKGIDYHYLYGNGAGQITVDENVFSHYFSEGDEIVLRGFRAEDEGQLITVDSGGYKVVTGANWDFTRYNTVDIDDLATVDSIALGTICSVKVKGFSTIAGYNSRHKMYISVYNKKGKEISCTTFHTDTNPYFYAGVTVARKIPAFNRITVHQGRIWGTPPSGRYIYASASDDIFSFSDEDMTNQFSWRMPADTAGAFTNLSTYNGELVAFKPQSVSIISGMSTRNYQMTTLSGVGCIAPKSVAVTNQGIMFLSYNGFYIYNGTFPKSFSRKLNTVYTDAVAGYDGRKYHASAVDSDGKREVVVYDTLYDVWHCEDDFNAMGYFRFRDGFYTYDSSTLYKICGTEDMVEWSMTLAQVGDFDLMGINEIWVRAEIESGAEFTVYTDFGDGKWQKHATFCESDGIAVYRSPVRFAHTDSYRVKLEGRGKVVIYGVELVTATGGRRHKERM